MDLLREFLHLPHLHLIVYTIIEESPWQIHHQLSPLGVGFFGT